ncbi:MAG: hypothetical protein LBH93_00790 [Chitinispirillales bacterium]|jgi:hypothetical protein|nr:hypothetical protein [Chitinispirillales bacterium]
MAIQVILAAGMLAALFILFLVISRAVGNIDNSLYKLEYMVRKDCDVRLESLELKFKMRAADKKFDELYGPRFSAEDIQNAVDGNE